MKDKEEQTEVEEEEEAEEEVKNERMRTPCPMNLVKASCLTSSYATSTANELSAVQLGRANKSVPRSKLFP